MVAGCTANDGVSSQRNRRGDRSRGRRKRREQERKREKEREREETAAGEETQRELTGAVALYGSLRFSTTPGQLGSLETTDCLHERSGRPIVEIQAYIMARTGRRSYFAAPQRRAGTHVVCARHLSLSLPRSPSPFSLFLSPTFDLSLSLSISGPPRCNSANGRAHDAWIESKAAKG